MKTLWLNHLAYLWVTEPYPFKAGSTSQVSTALLEGTSKVIICEWMPPN